jgi:ribosome-binding protein aMBF1 (putative translation factor)
MTDRDDEIPPSCVVIHEQPRTGVFVNARGQVVIRQDDYYHGDMWVVVSVEHVPALLAAIEATAQSPAAGFHPDEEKPELDLDEPEPVPKRPNDAPQSEPPFPWLSEAQIPQDRRERIRAALSAGGKSNRRIAHELNCSEATVRRVAATLTSSDRDSRRDSDATLGATLAPDAQDDAPPTHLFSPEKEGQAV